MSLHKSQHFHDAESTPGVKVMAYADDIVLYQPQGVKVMAYADDIVLYQPQGVKVMAYADDIVLYCDTHYYPVAQVQKSLNLIAEAVARAGFLFAPAKTQANVVHKKYPQHQDAHGWQWHRMGEAVQLFGRCYWLQAEAS